MADKCKMNISTAGPHLNVGTTCKNVVDNGPHHVDANVYGKIPLMKGVPPGVGGGVQYRNDYGHGANLNVDHIFDHGTTVSVGGNVRLMESKDQNTHLDFSAGASQHFGKYGSGPIGGNAMLSFTKRF